MEVGASLGQFVHARGLGHTFATGTGFILAHNPDLVGRGRSFRAPGPLGRDWARPGLRPGAPDLAVEIVSPDDRPGKIAAKVAHWLQFGTRLVIVVCPEGRRARVHRPGHPPRDLGEADVLDGEDVMPGWTLPLPQLFP